MKNNKTNMNSGAAQTSPDPHAESEQSTYSAVSPSSAVKGSAAKPDTPAQAALRRLVESDEHGGKLCDRCKCCEMESVSCNICDGSGRTEPGDLYEEDPNFYDWEDTEPCYQCGGEASWWICHCDENGLHAQPPNGRGELPTPATESLTKENQ
jgi:hypothetical protein